MGNALTLRRSSPPAEPVRIYPTPINPERDLDYEPPASDGFNVGTLAAYLIGALLAVQLLPAIVATKHTVKTVITQTIQPSNPQTR